MTRTILLSGGPDDGRIVELLKSKTKYRITEGPVVKGGKAVMSGRQGIYQQTGEFHNLNEIFLWKGWEK